MSDEEHLLLNSDPKRFFELAMLEDRQKRLEGFRNLHDFVIAG